MLTCDRTRPRQYRSATREYFAVSQVCAVLHGETKYSTSAAQRGTDLHDLFAVALGHQAGWCGAPVVPDAYAPHMAAIQDFLRDHAPHVLAIEKAYAHPSLPYAGTIDCLVRLGRETGVLDLKTGQAARWHAVQVEAYRRMIDPRLKGWLLYLTLGQQRAYKLVPVRPSAHHWAAFQHALNILLWREHS